MPVSEERPRWTFDFLLCASIGIAGCECVWRVEKCTFRPAAKILVDLAGLYAAPDRVAVVSTGGRQSINFI